jgi:HNH endonuclease
MTKRELWTREAAELFVAQKGYCACGCKRSLAIHGFRVDHIRSRAAGGTDDRRNKQLLAPICNVEKSCMDPLDFMRRRGRLL